MQINNRPLCAIRYNLQDKEQQALAKNRKIPQQLVESDRSLSLAGCAIYPRLFS